MSIERRLLWLLLLCAPLVWAVGLGVSVNRAQREVNELFDTEMIRLARQVQATMAPVEVPPSSSSSPASAAAASASVPSGAAPARAADLGAADVQDLAIAVWDSQGRLKLADREGTLLPRYADVAGFRDLVLANEAWRVYYLQSLDGSWLVAAGQKAHEREELVLDLTLGQLVPWLFVLPVLLGVMVWAVRRALAPVRQLTRELGARSADELSPVAESQAPAELRPMLAEMNSLFARIESTVARERRFTADAAHELRTPLAVLRAQWDVVRRAAPGEDRAAAEAKLGAGLDRLDRLVTQMLALSRVEGSSAARSAAPVDWLPVVEQALSDCLPLAERRHIELDCEWPAAGAAAWPLQGDAALLTVLLRNLLDNAARYAPPGSTVLLRLGVDSLVVENAGPPLGAAQAARLGERFYRPDGQDEAGSGLGLSIVQRIAAMHGLIVGFGSRDDGQGVRVRVSGAEAPAATFTR